jgi:eukaryotic-like serine/threonine-protein kinase
MADEPSDRTSPDALVSILYDELHRLAHHYMRGERPNHTLQTTAVVNEAYLRLVGIDRMRWRDRTHFVAMAATAMRRVLVDHARAHVRDKRGGGVAITSLDTDVAGPEPDVDVLALNDALDRLESLDPQQARIVELRYFGGLTVEEVAAALGVSTGTVKRDWAAAKAWLYGELRPGETFLENPVRLSAIADAPDLTGRTIASYTIGARLGAGGMGEVYVARDAKLDRTVALKLLSRDVAPNPERLHRFHAEARAASSINHPHILVIHDFGDLDGRPYMVTEYIEGETVRQRLERGSLPPAEAVDVALQVGAALTAAHARGLVHRDIKPENVMRRPDGYVKVLDFGLAKLTARDERDSGSNTLPGLLMGTPRYMSPEQARGKDVDARSDIWSLGVLVYEMLAGRPPFAGATHADTLAAILDAEPVPLTLQLPEPCPPLERVVARSLRKNRIDRYAAIGDMVADLTAAKRQLDHDSSAGRRDEGSRVSTLDAASTPRGPVVKRTRLIVMPFRLARPDPDVDFLAFSLADAIATTLASVDSLIVRSSITATRLMSDPLDLSAIAAAAHVDAVLTGTLLRAGNHLRVNAQLISSAEGTILWSERMDVPLDDVIRVQDELGARIADSLAVPLTPREQELLRRDVPASPRAYDLYLRGNNHFYESDGWSIARDLYIECVAEDPVFAPAWARLGRCYRMTAKFRSQTIDEARENLKRAEASFRKAFDLNPDLPLAHHLYTAVETDLGRAEDAVLRLVRRARQRRADPELYAGLVHACRYCGLLDASVAAHERARQLDPQMATSVAPTYWMLGEYERAIEGFSGFFVGLPQASLGRDADAIAAARASAEAVRDPLTRSYQTLLPLVLEHRFDECRRLLDELAPRNPDPESIFHVARTYARIGATEPALAQFDRAVDMGFVPHSWFVRDPWLEPLAAEPRFQNALARADRRQREAARVFREAGGERLLGLANASASSSTDRRSDSHN